jgi:hypothetical protein
LVGQGCLLFLQVTLLLLAVAVVVEHEQVGVELVVTELEQNL